MSAGIGQPVEIHGRCDPRFDRVRTVFTESFSRGYEVGAGVCVFHGNDLVVDLWGGLADRRTGRPWQRDTPCLVFSCTKALTAACALRLWEQGCYEMDGPATAWWPEFACRGKEHVTAAHLLSHAAGLPVLESPVSVAAAADASAVAALLAAQEPAWEPGTAHGYHALTFGWLAGEIVRRLSGQTVGDYLAQQISGPHGLGIWLGAPDDVIDRAARLTNRPLGTPGQPAATAARRATTDTISGRTTGHPTTGHPTTGHPATGHPTTGHPAAGRRPTSAATASGSGGGKSSLLARALSNPDPASIPGGSNNRAVLRGGWPASGAVTSAAALASFYRLLVAGRILDPRTLQAALVPRVHGLDRVMGMTSSFGLGFLRPTAMFPVPRAGADTAFGHIGFGGSVGLGDVSRGIALAYVPNRLASDVSGGLRGYRLIEALYASLG